MKIAKNNLLNSILSSVWMIDKGYAQSAMPLVVELIKGKPVSFDTQTNTNSLYSINSATYFDYDDEDGAEEVKEEMIAILSVKGAITKNDQYCGPTGTVTLGKRIKALDADPNVKSIILDIDTPGGEASQLNTTATIIKECKTPVIASYSGLCCSAGYYLASACDEIYAQENNDMVGSIGTMLTVADFGKMYDKAGIKIHDIYADQSTDKNQDYYEALKGNYEAYKAEWLNPLAQEFIDFVKGSREDVSSSALTGKVFNSKRAMNKGLIDGVKTFDEVIERANELSATNKNTNSGEAQTNNTTMKFENIANALGFDNTEMEAQDGHISMSVENMEKIEAALANVPSATDEAVENAVSAEAFDALVARVDAAESGLAEAKEKLEIMGEATHIAPTTASKANDEVKEDPVWNKDENTNNQAIDKDLGK